MTKDEKRAKKKAAATAVGGVAATGVVVGDSVVTSKGEEAGGKNSDGVAVNAGTEEGAADGAGDGEDGQNTEDGGKGLSSLLMAYASDSDGSADA